MTSMSNMKLEAIWIPKIQKSLHIFGFEVMSSSRVQIEFDRFCRGKLQTLMS